MKNLIFLLLAFHGALAIADQPATHGMFLTGTTKIYLSHLPMFHSPHDYQVLLEVELDPKAKEIYLQNKAPSKETVYTISPQVFVLPQMVQHPQTFKAQLFKGHFERGGKLISDAATIVIKKVLYFKKFEPGIQKPLIAQYILFGNEKEQFMAHVIMAKPDFDQIVNVSISNPPADLLTVLNLTGQNNNVPLKPGQIVNEKIKVLQSLYFETGDLSM